MRGVKRIKVFSWMRLRVEIPPKIHVQTVPSWAVRLTRQFTPPESMRVSRT